LIEPAPDIWASSSSSTQTVALPAPLSSTSAVLVCKSLPLKLPNLDKIRDTDGYVIPGSIADEMQAVMKAFAG
jgi:hypothetical protein